MLYLSSPVALSCPDFLERRSLTSFKSLRGLAGGLVIPAAAAGHKANNQRCIQRQKDCIGKRKLAHKIIFQFINSPHVAFLVHLRLIYPSASRHSLCSLFSPPHILVFFLYLPLFFFTSPSPRRGRVTRRSRLPPCCRRRLTPCRGRLLQYGPLGPSRD
jgi:hypothetical protein